MNKQITNTYTKTVDEIKTPEKVVKNIIENISKAGQTLLRINSFLPKIKSQRAINPLA